MIGPDVWILVDDTQLQTISAFEGDTWDTLGPGSGPWVGNTSTSTEIPQNIFFSFQGTAVSFTGNISSSPDSAGFFVDISDTNAPYQVPYPNTSVPVYGQWYQTPLLSDVHHNISLSSIVVDLDYAIVIPGPTTPLSGSTIVVDDSNKEIVYVGHSWTQNTAPINFVGGISGLPMGNSTHSTSTKGDGFKFQFAGSNVNVYGFSEGTNTGSISIDFTLDGKTTPFNFTLPVVSAAVLQFSTPFKFFSADNIDTGNHTLEMNVTDAFGNQIFIFDYITYVASYSTLESKPNFTAPINMASRSSSTHKNVGATVGGIIGGLVGLTIVSVSLWVVFRNRRQRRNHAIHEVSSPYYLRIPQQPVTLGARKRKHVPIRCSFTAQQTLAGINLDLEPLIGNNTLNQVVLSPYPAQAGVSSTPGMAQAQIEEQRTGANTTSQPPAYS